MKLRVWLIAAALMFSACSTQQKKNETAAPSGKSEFVTVNGTAFQLRGRAYHFAGANLWYGAYLGSPGVTGDRERLIKELDQLRAIGITNIRVLGLSEASELKRAVRPAVIAAPGHYDEELLNGLDFLLAELAKRDMKAVIYVNNFWQWSGGMSQYVSWFTQQPVLDPDLTGNWNAFMDNSARFYTLSAAQQAFRDAVRTLITRRNSVTAKLYSEDPTIMSWQLANEPRPGSDATGRSNSQAFVGWLDETAKYIKTLAPHQLVSTGNEGWMGTAGDRSLFVEAHRSSHIDYLTFHMWAPNWSWFDPKRAAETYDGAWSKAKDYLNWHIDAARDLGKPIVLEEFGMNRDGGSFDPRSTTAYRDRYYRDIFALLEKRASEGAPIAGSNFWAWGGAGRAANADWMWKPGDAFVGDPPQEAQGLYCVFDSDASTIAVIKEHATSINLLNR
ncbi:MAG: cellulase family glycosylhydrolase [Povalibacter sp.]